MRCWWLVSKFSAAVRLEKQSRRCRTIPEKPTDARSYHTTSQTCAILRNSHTRPEIGFQAGFRPDANRQNNNFGPPAGRRPAAGPILGFSDQTPVVTRPGNPMSGPESSLRNMEQAASETYSYFRWGGSLSQQCLSACRCPPMESDANSYGASCNIKCALYEIR